MWGENPCHYLRHFDFLPFLGEWGHCYEICRWAYFRTKLTSYFLKNKKYWNMVTQTRVNINILQGSIALKVKDLYNYIQVNLVR